MMSFWFVIYAGQMLAFIVLVAAFCIQWRENQRLKKELHVSHRSNPGE